MEQPCGRPNSPFPPLEPRAASLDLHVTPLHVITSPHLESSHLPSSIFDWRMGQARVGSRAPAQFWCMLLLGLVTSASGMATPPKHVPKKQLDAAFTAWSEKQALEKEVKRLVNPDVTLRLVFEGVAQPAVLPGSATTDALHGAAAHLHNLDEDQRLRFVLHGKALPRGVALSDSPLAGTTDLEVSVMPCDWPVKRGCRTNSGASAIAATRARRGAARPPKQLTSHGGWENMATLNPSHGG